jgi:hypothetical protein
LEFAPTSAAAILAEQNGACHNPVPIAAERVVMGRENERELNMLVIIHRFIGA